MKKIQQQLIENKNKIRRDKFLSALDSKFSEFLSQVEYSNDTSCIKNAAFPEWDEQAKVIKSSRGKVKYWSNFNFKNWQELIAVLKKFNQVKNYIGWFFIDHDGPYYRMSINTFLSYIPNMSDYGSKKEHYNFGWVGDTDDVGILIEKNRNLSNDKEFTISIWGI